MRKHLAILLVCGFSAWGCDELLQENPRSFIDPDQFYQSESQATAALIAAYDPLNRYRIAMPLVGDMATDVIWAQAGGTLLAFDQHVVTPTEDPITDLWKDAYEGVNRANAVIDRLAKSELRPAVKDQITAEARFLRAFYYYALVRVYGGVPLLTSETTSLKNLKVARATEAEVYDQIVTDLQTAEAALSLSAPSAGRVARGAAMALLAKVHLERGDFQMARDKARQVIDSGAYGLWATYEAVFLQTSENGKEDIFSIQYTSNVGEGNGLRNATLPGELAPWYCCGPIIQQWKVTQKLRDSYEAGDTRRAVNAALSVTIEGQEIALEHISNLKYLDGLIEETNDGDGGNNFPVLRYADVLLTFAEAENELSGPSPAAREAVNRVRRRAFAVDLGAPSAHDVPASIDQAAFRELILLERLREFPMEGHRWFDLKRTGRLVAVLGIPEYRVLHPIPQRDLGVNELLEQNAGYN